MAFEQLAPTVVGAFLGLVWAGFGYAIAKTKNAEAFEPTKFGKTILLGIILAGMAQGLGLNITEIEGMAVATLLTIFIDKLAGLLLKVVPAKTKT